MRITLVLASLGVFNSALVLAQDYPSRPIKLVVANAPGTPLDVLPRILAPEMAKFLGQPVVVENKPGAAQVIGLEHVAKQAPADGYTIASVSVPSLAILPVTVKDLRFDPIKDLPPFVGYAEGRLILGASSKVPWRSFNEMVAAAKASPGKLNYGTSAPTIRLSVEAVFRDLGLSLTPVPYSSAALLFNAITSGEVHMTMVADSAAVTLGERFRVLAVTGAKRKPPYLNVPTLAELGYPQIPGVSYSLNVRTGTPKNATEKLYAAASKALQQPEVKDRFAKFYLEIIERGPQAAGSDLAEQGKLFSDIARKIGFQPE